MGLDNHKRKMSISLSITLTCPSNRGQREHLEGSTTSARDTLPVLPKSLKSDPKRSFPPLEGLMSGLERIEPLAVFI